MNVKFLYATLIFSVMALSLHCQSKRIKLNDQYFSFAVTTLDTLNGSKKEILTLHRGDKKLLSHTLLEEEGDCSSYSIQLGEYTIVGNDIIFYTYWATCDRMPDALLKHGFRKQIYTVTNTGILHSKEALIYIEDYVESTNKDLYEGNSWKHKGFQYLSKKPENNLEQEYLNDYIQRIEKKYNAEFVLNIKKKVLEQETREVLKEKIHEHTKDWMQGDVYGRVRK